ncbi:hypothetical protein MA16_Dca005288 [Dendrobium catenatum]|uniref:Uncharacterized protein n=1 Tax=Dendrobium catenatum TaxID=906689 RepID=A0A2I0VLT0_9ASPA|nr:hypothetical protein MA16_Dca005288 [Dendrobium catenatum]
MQLQYNLTVHLMIFFPGKSLFGESIEVNIMRDIFNCNRPFVVGSAMQTVSCIASCFFPLKLHKNKTWLKGLRKISLLL